MFRMRGGFLLARRKIDMFRLHLRHLTDGMFLAGRGNQSRNGQSDAGRANGESHSKRHF